MAKKKVHAARKPAGKAAKKKKVTKPRLRAAAPSPAKATAASYFQWVHAQLDKLIANFPEDKALFQTTPTDNHLLWTLGHLAVTYAWLASMLDGKSHPLPESYNTLFGYQSKPTGDAAAYPPVSEVKAHYAGAHARFSDAIARLAGANLARPPASESYGFAKTRHDVILKAGWHDAWHSGQIATLRRALGLPPTM